jgi:hypothetical protein
MKFCFALVPLVCGGKLREDLFKKFASADGIAGKKPYGFCTRMIHCKGWKRLEANRMFAFQDVEQKNFNSIMRRSLVWRCKARFEDPHVIEAAYPDIHKDGVFKKDPDLEAFLTSGPAVAAGLQLQHAFEMDHGKDQCIDMIEQYVSWGGDHGLTEATMRRACKLPPRDVREATTRAGAVLDVVEVDEDKEDTEQWYALQKAIMEFLLIKKRLHVSSTMLSSFKCPENCPNVSKGEMLDALVARSYALKCPGSGRAAAAGVFMPLLSFKVPLEKLIDHKSLTCNVQLPEVYDVQGLSSYLHGCLYRRENVDILADTWRKMSKRRKAARAGRPDAEEKKIKLEMQERGDKLLQAESNADKLLEQLQGPAAKRRRGKTPSSSEVKVETGNYAAAVCTYHYGGSGQLRSRKHVDGIGAQKFTRRVQQVLLPHTHDLDIENSLFSLMHQLLTRLGLNPSMPEECREALNACWTDRTGICSKLCVPAAEGKQLLVSIFYGGGFPRAMQGIDLLHDLQKAAIYCKWVAVAALPDDFKDVQRDETKKNPEASLLAYLYCACEDFILSHWLEFLQKTLTPKHLSLHFDGVRVAAMHNIDVDDICRQCEHHIAEKTGFHVRIKEKKHRYILEILHAKAIETKDPRFHDAHRLRQTGNCIPHSLACLEALPDDKEAALADMANPHNVHMQQRGCRTYEQCVELLGCKLRPVLPQQQDLPAGSFLLHVENGGRPHCVAVRRDEDEPVTIWDTDCEFQVAATDFRAAILEGTDASTCVLFVLVTDADDKMEEDDVELRLLGMSAGAAGMLDESGDEEEQAASTELEWLDEHGQVTVEAALLKELEAEISSYLEKARCNTIKAHHGAFPCPACPFRTFDRCSRLTQHLQRYHRKKNQFCCSGTKQLRVALALHDSDMLAQRRRGSYLKRSAELLKKSINPSLSKHNNCIDRSIRLLLDASGPRIVHVEALAAQQARRVGRLWYTRAFAERIFQELLLQHGKATSPGHVKLPN